MCGIAGVLSFDGRPVDEADLVMMTDALLHRGPDDGGCFTDGAFGFGNRRLSIIDLAGGHQPMSNEAETVWAVQNGEIYNFPELRRELEARGYRFRTSSDTEAILAAYEVWGVPGIERLRGMFALAIWDTTARRLVLARDQVGIKPLYYYRDGHTLLFASEIRALLVDARVPRQLSLASMDRFLSFYYVPGEETIFEGIRRLAPGHLMVCEDGRVELRRYWRPTAAPVERDERECAEELRAHLRAAVERHMLADVPVGVFLSGGLDSSTIVAMLGALGRTDTPTFSVGFSRGAGYFDETDDARRVAEHFGMDHRILVVDPDVVRLLPRLVDSLEEPMGGATTLLTYLISEAARQHVKVALSGTGGDELFGGYRRYLGALAAGRLHRFPRLGRRLLSAGLHGLPAADETRVGYHLNRLRRLLDAAESPHPDAYVRMVSYFTPPMKARLYRPTVVSALARQDSVAEYRAYFDGAGSTDVLGQLSYIDLLTYLPDDLLLFTDKMSMAVSLEVRVPLLDLELVEFAGTLPARFRIKGTELKRLLRTAMAPLLPPHVLQKSKQGFSAPVGAWIRRDLRTLCDEVLSPEAIGRRGLWDPAYVSELVAAHHAGRRELGDHLFALMNFELWCRNFLDGERRSGARRARSDAGRSHGSPATVTLGNGGTGTR